MGTLEKVGAWYSIVWYKHISPVGEILFFNVARHFTMPDFACTTRAEILAHAKEAENAVCKNLILQ